MSEILMKKSNEKHSKGSNFYTRESVFGMKYRCRYCGKDNLGMWFGEDMRRMHYKSCQVLRHPCDTKS